MEILRRIWAMWLRFGHFMGDLVGRLVLTIFYFTVFLPFGLGVRLFGDPLEIRNQKKARWHERSTTDLTLDDARRLS